MVRGEPGIGKTALLQGAIDAAPEMRLLRAVGIESEIELAFAGLHRFALRCSIASIACRTLSVRP